MGRRKWIFWVIAADILLTVLVAGTPYIFTELFMAATRFGWTVTPQPVDPKAFAVRPGPAAGEVIDGFWLVEQIAPDTWAIGEPADDPDNYEYLLIGKDRALLIDAGATKDHDIHRAIAGITDKPVTVIPTHLHYDHTNGLKFFSSIALIELPETLQKSGGNHVQLGRYQYESWNPLRFEITEWIKPDGMIDLGGRMVQVLLTPGHTTNSVSIWEPEAKRLFTGDLLYPTTLFAFGPDSSLSAYIETLDRLAGMLPADTRIYGAHCCRNDAPPSAPWLDMGDLHDAREAMERVLEGHADGRGFIIHRFPVNARMTLLTLYPLGNW